MKSFISPVIWITPLNSITRDINKCHNSFEPAYIATALGVLSGGRDGGSENSFETTTVEVKNKGGDDEAD
jgi:hypothetical protein